MSNGQPLPRDRTPSTRMASRASPESAQACRIPEYQTNPTPAQILGILALSSANELGVGRTDHPNPRTALLPAISPPMKHSEMLPPDM
jgi:hypothetical protein